TTRRNSERDLPGRSVLRVAGADGLSPGRPPTHSLPCLRTVVSCTAPREPGPGQRARRSISERSSSAPTRPTNSFTAATSVRRRLRPPLPAAARAAGAAAFGAAAAFVPPFAAACFFAAALFFLLPLRLPASSFL